MTIAHTNYQNVQPPVDTTAMATLSTERREILAVAKRMFNEGFKKSLILRMCAMTEEEFVTMIRDLHQSRTATLA